MNFDPWHLIWILLLCVSIILCWLGFDDGDWVGPHIASNTGPTGATIEMACGPWKFCDSGGNCDQTYGAVKSIPFMWWQIGTVCMGLGIAIMTLGLLGALLTMFAQSYQPLAHNIEIFGGVLALAGLICFSIGMKDMGAPDNVYNKEDHCKLCSPGTSLFFLENCSIEDGFIMMIIGVIIEAIAGCVGWNVNHRESAPAAYRERTWTGRPSHRAGAGGAGAANQGRWNAPRGAATTSNPVHAPANQAGRTPSVKVRGSSGGGRAA